MSDTQSRLVASSGLAPAYAAVRLRLGLVFTLFAFAAGGWWWTAEQMHGMDGGPWTALGSFGWFLGVWVVMMAAMMFPSIAPTVALYARMTRQRSPMSPVAFTAGYLLTWSAAGVGAFVLAAGATRWAGSALAWGNHGHALAGATLLGAAAYEVSPLKEVCLGKCRSPLGVLLGSWREGPIGGLLMGIRNGLWCLGCCWALMASLFAVGVMNITWMAIIAGFIGLEKALPWRRSATYGIAGALLALGGLLLVAPGAVLWLGVPSGQSMQGMP
ncbi:MAG: hypothetical protein NVS3B26_19680 [Mycobacteriales bacterium]